MLTNEWNRDLPAIEKRRDQERGDMIDAYIERILADQKQGAIALAERLAEIYAERDAKIAAIRAARAEQEV